MLQQLFAGAQNVTAAIASIPSMARYQTFGDVVVSTSSTTITVRNHEATWTKTFANLYVALQDLKQLDLCKSVELKRTYCDTDIASVHFSFWLVDSLNAATLGGLGFRPIGTHHVPTSAH
jgi:hypothetical protein